MSKSGGKFDFGYGVVYWKPYPTKRDKVGCDGIFVSRVVLTARGKHAAQALAEQLLKAVKLKQA